MSDIREKLVELFHEHNSHYVVFCDDCFKDTPEEFNSRMYGLADHLIANGVTVQEHGRWLYSSIENPTFCVCDQCAASFVIGRNSGDYNYCPSCGAKMLPAPPKGE